MCQNRSANQFVCHVRLTSWVHIDYSWLYMHWICLSAVLCCFCSHFSSTSTIFLCSMHLICNALDLNKSAQNVWMKRKKCIGRKTTTFHCNDSHINGTCWIVISQLSWPISGYNQFHQSVGEKNKIKRICQRGKVGIREEQNEIIFRSISFCSEYSQLIRWDRNFLIANKTAWEQKPRQITKKTIK